jgi:hypothetical protein
VAERPFRNRGTCGQFEDQMPSPPQRRVSLGLVPLLWLGVMLARRGFVATASLALAGITVLGLAALGLGLAAEANAPLHTIPTLASSALAWGAGFVLAFSAATHALRRDRENGVRHLLEARSLGLGGYLFARVGGLAVLLALVVGGGTLLLGLIMTLAAARLGVVPRTLHATLAALCFALGYALVLAPVAYAALGARSRMGGYLSLLAVVVLPELVALILAGVLPEAIVEVMAIPSALGALRASLSPGTVDGFQLARAVVALAVFAVLASMLVLRSAVLLERERGARDGVVA